MVQFTCISLGLLFSQRLTLKHQESAHVRYLSWHFVIRSLERRGHASPTALSNKGDTFVDCLRVLIRQLRSRHLYLHGSSILHRASIVRVEVWKSE
jgi:hypothetical protein